MSTIDEVFGYVMNSPENTNPSVLRSLLNNIEEKDENFLIEIELDGTEDLEYPTVTCDKTEEEITDAFENGKKVYITYKWKGTTGLSHQYDHLIDNTFLLTEFGGEDVWYLFRHISAGIYWSPNPPCLFYTELYFTKGEGLSIDYVRINCEPYED